MPKNKLAVVGLGYVGLPLAQLASRKGLSVTGIDIDEDKLAQIQSENPDITTTTDFTNINDADIVVVAVPTPVLDDYTPDLKPLEGALKSIAPYTHPEQVIIIESTINPGVMDEVIKPIFEGKDVHLAHCPERINPGDPEWTVANIPRVLGSYTEAGAKLAHDFYASILDADIKIMGSVAEAEAVKILENTFRDVNIAFINEMAKSFDKLGLNIANIIAGAATKPFAFMPHYPGNGVGGHCISVDPYYMIERGRQAGFDHEFLKLARAINNGMPAYTVSILESEAKKLNLDLTTETVAILGVAYKRDIDDIRESPVLDIIEGIKNQNINHVIFDKYVPAKSTVANLKEALEKASVVMLGTNHTDIVEYLTPENLKKHDIKLVIDGKNALDMATIKEANIPYHGIGRS